MKFIKLTAAQNDFPIYVNISLVAGFFQGYYNDKKCTEIYYTDDDESPFWRVKETPEEILKMLKEKK